MSDLADDIAAFLAKYPDETVLHTRRCRSRDCGGECLTTGPRPKPTSGAGQMVADPATDLTGAIERWDRHIHDKDGG